MKKIFALILCLYSVGLQAQNIDGFYLNPPQKIAEFNFEDHNGQPFNKDRLLGHWTFMFFGFTNCGMVCPTTLSVLNQTYQKMEKSFAKEDLPQIVLMSVDPDRDSKARLASYVKSFNPHFLGARAGIAETILLEKQLHIAAAKIEADGSGKNHYTINHTADILVINPKGEVQAFLSFPHRKDQLIKDYKLILAGKA